MRKKEELKRILKEASDVQSMTVSIYSMEEIRQKSLFAIKEEKGEYILKKVGEPVERRGFYLLKRPNQNETEEDRDGAS